MSILGRLGGDILVDVSPEPGFLGFGQSCQRLYLLVEYFCFIAGGGNDASGCACQLFLDLCEPLLLRSQISCGRLCYSELIRKLNVGCFQGGNIGFLLCNRSSEGFKLLLECGFVARLLVLASRASS